MIGRKDPPHVLPCPRPRSFLQAQHVIVPISASDAQEISEINKGVGEDEGGKYVVVGGKAWKKLVEQGKIQKEKKESEKEVHISAFAWLKQLFEV